MTTKHKINRAFKELRKAGYVAKQDFACCMNCGWSELGDIPKAVFYSHQDTSRFKNYGELLLSWDGDGSEIVRIFENAGLKVNWNGSIWVDSLKNVIEEPEKREKNGSI